MTFQFSSIVITYYPILEENQCVPIENYNILPPR